MTNDVYNSMNGALSKSIGRTNGAGFTWLVRALLLPRGREADTRVLPRSEPAGLLGSALDSPLRRWRLY